MKSVSKVEEFLVEQKRLRDGETESKKTMEETFKRSTLSNRNSKKKNTWKEGDGKKNREFP